MRYFAKKKKKKKIWKGLYRLLLETDQANDKGRCGGDRRDDLPGNLLGRVAISGVYAVIHGAKVRSSSDEVDVVIGIVIFLKLYGIKAESSK